MSDNHYVHVQVFRIELKQIADGNELCYETPVLFLRRICQSLSIIQTSDKIDCCKHLIPKPVFQLTHIFLIDQQRLTEIFSEMTYLKCDHIKSEKPYSYLKQTPSRLVLFGSVFGGFGQPPEAETINFYCYFSPRNFISLQFYSVHQFSAQVHN